MKKYLHHSFITLKSETYLSLIVFLGPFLYFLAGINIDIYSPSMPTIATYFHATIVETKNTISVSLLGCALGGLTFGILIDSIGRKKVLLIGMFFYVVFSAAALFCKTIHELQFIRLIQSFSVASIVGARVLIIDLFSGRRYTIAILYTSIGYGLGPIVGPFIGGLLQYYFNWQANFIVLALLSFITLLLLVIFVKESISVKHPLQVRHVMSRCFSVISHKNFMAGVVIGGITQIQLMLYPTIGPFIIEKQLHQSVLVYGNSALIVGSAYLVGSLINRLLLKHLLPKTICDLGYIVLMVGLVMSYLFSVTSSLELTTVMLPIILTSMSAGFIFPNVLSANLKQFSHLAGIATAIQSSVLLFIAAIGVFFISHVHVVKLSQLSAILFVLAFFECIIFYACCRSVFFEQT